MVEKENFATTSQTKQTTVPSLNNFSRCGPWAALWLLAVFFLPVGLGSAGVLLPGRLP